MKNQNKTPRKSLFNSNNKDRKLILQYVVKQVEKGTNLKICELKKQFNEEQLFYIALKHVTTTKKALCTALNIPVEAGCRYKRQNEKNGNLVQSIYVVVCPFTKHFAHEISTNPKEFERLLKSNTNQLRLFE